ncbi:MAG: hypothetical protein Terrestrivirus4_122 [Terrestrivirus sp.]|uniref:EF-1-gamma C-terminal domain-containing protein n=1 Tax=Terrestrivirus sp. TaxID=2487775 RepID=A0A3G4ZNV3_9VIRU|nr:MAG: hypothetical protein Terrestrivirus4_122 [Terrestrivirus sp.]
MCYQPEGDQSSKIDKIIQTTQTIQEEEVHTLMSWKYFYTGFSKKDTIPPSAFVDYLKSIQNLKVFVASYKYNDDLPLMDFVQRNYVQGIFQRLSPYIRGKSFAIADVTSNPKNLSILWVFDTPLGDNFLTEKPEKKKSKNPDEEEDGDDDNVSEDKDIHDMFDWNETNLSPELYNYFQVVDTTRFVYK